MSGPGLSVVLEAEPDAAMRAAILAPLLAYNTATAGDGLWQTLAVTVRDETQVEPGAEAGRVVGGLWGHVGYGFLFVELLAVGPVRHAGIGTRVMQAAEAECRRRGLAGIWLDTWTFQAPGFYAKLGFTECGRIENYPPGHDRVFMVKRLG